MLAEGIANLFLSLVALSFLYIWLRCHWRWKIDYFRNELFALRDKLFDYALQGKLSFDDPAYVLLRSRINRLLRFAHKTTSVRGLFVFNFVRFATNLRWGGRDTDRDLESNRILIERQVEEWEAALNRLENDKVREEIHALYTNVLLLVACQIIPGITVIIVTRLFKLLSTKMLGHLNERLRKFMMDRARITEIEARYTEEMPAADALPHSAG